MKNKIPKVVWLLSLVSFLNDTASEMLYPVLPIFITQILGAPVFVVGIIEGVAEGTASLFKAIFGYYSDKLQKRKIFVVGGYGSSAVAKIIIALSYTWPIVLVGRFVDRLGKGARTGARDAMLLDATSEKNKGFIFGFHRSMDTAGAVLGPSIALGLLYILHNNIRLILYVAIIPAFFSLVFFFFLKEPTKKLLTNKTKLTFSLKNTPLQFKVFLLGMAVFSLGNSSDTFLILRAKNLGLALPLVIGAYILYNIVYAAFSTPAGKISDMLGAKKVFLLGLVIFILVYLGFALDTQANFMWILFAIYGLYIALTDGVSKAWVGGMVDNAHAATAYGVVYTVTSIFAVFSSVVGGYLWTVFAPSATFYFAALCATFAFIVFLGVFPRTHNK